MAENQELLKAIKQLTLAITKGDKFELSTIPEDESEEDKRKRLKKEQEALEKQLQLLEGQREIIKDISGIRKKMLEQRTIDGALSQDGIDKLTTYLDKLKQVDGVNDKRITDMERLASLAADEALGNDEREKAMNQLLQDLEDIEEGYKRWSELGEYISKTHERIGEALGVSAGIFKELALEIDTTGKKFRSSTGFSTDFRDSMLEVQKATVDAGVGMAEISAGFGAMAARMSSFDPKAKKANETMATQIALLSKLGVDANTAAGSVDFLERSMSMSRDAAAGMTMELATFADGMGVTSQKMMADFESVSGTLAMQGPKMVQTFKNIAAQAKATGMSVSALVEMAQRFNTFEDAAGNVAKLNAVLGTQMSTIDIMGMRQDERIDYLRDQIQMTVGDFNNLDMYTQQFIASAMGFKDVGEAARFINMSAAEQDEFRARAEASAKTQEQIAEITQDLIPVMERFQLSMKKAALALSPVLSAFMLLFDAIFALDELAHNRFLPTLAMTLLLISGFIVIKQMAAAYGVLTSAVKLLGFEFANLNKSMGLMGVVLVALAFVLTGDFSNGVKTAAVGVAALAFSFIILEGASRKVVGAFGVLLMILGASINPLFVNAFAFMAIGVLALGLAFQFVSTKAIIAAVVLGLMFGAFAYFFDSMSGAGESLLSLSFGFLMLGSSLAIVGALFSNPLIIYGMAIFTGFMLALAASMGLMGMGAQKMADGFASMFENLSGVRSLLAELDGVVTNSFIAVTEVGGARSAVIANGDGLAGILAGTVAVDVNIPQIQAPNVNVKVYMNGKEVATEIEKTVGRGG
tara:strand:- start:3770 stop:6196 length:2427 start_codon:yes stop_codon:yes gene_type:complete